MIVPFFQFCALPRLQVTRDVSGFSVPIIAFGAGGPGLSYAILVLNLWVVEILVQKSNAEVACTEMSADEISTKVYLVSFLAGPK